MRDSDIIGEGTMAENKMTDGMPDGGDDTAMTSGSTDDKDFKYCMQDTEKVYIGARYSYGELMADEHVPFKFQTIIEHYIAKDTDMDTTLESQLYYMKPDDFTCRTYQHLRAKVKFQIMKEKHLLFGRSEMRYVEEVLPVEKFAEINLAQKKASGVIVRELVLSKMGIAGFRV